MHRHEIAQGFIEECQARSTDLSGDPFGDRTHHSNFCDYEEPHASVLLGEQENTWPAADASPPTVAVESQAHYENCAAGGVGVTTGHRVGQQRLKGLHLQVNYGGLTMLSTDPSKRIFVLKREETNSRKASSDHAVEGIYDRIKSLLLAHTLAPGQLLQIGTLAEELGVSTTPVREALTRLAAERLIVFAPKRGFFAKTASEDELRGLYTLNQTLLDSALREWNAGAANDDEMKVSSKIFASLPLSDKPDQLTRTIDDLFVRIATRSGIGELADIVRNFNDRLHHARMIEGEIIEDAVDELARLRQLYSENNKEQLQLALQTYHQKRRELVSSICKELLFRPFLAENK